MDDQEYCHEEDFEEEDECWETEEEEEYWESEEVDWEFEDDPSEVVEFPGVDEIDDEPFKWARNLVDKLGSFFRTERIEQPEEKRETLAEQYARIEFEIDAGIRSLEVGEVDLMSIKIQMQREETKNAMAEMGMTWGGISDLADDVNHLIEDEMLYPEGRDIRKQFRSLNESEQDEVLRRAMEEGKITREQAAWFGNQWR